MHKALIYAALTAAAVVFLFSLSCSQQKTAEESADCAISRGTCVKEVNGRKFVLDVFPKPVRAMRELTFRVETETGSEEIVADLDMPGMYMGENRVVLRRMKGGYEGRGVLPRCPSGGRLWRMTLSTPETGKVSFRFNVDR